LLVCYRTLGSPCLTKVPGWDAYVFEAILRMISFRGGHLYAQTRNVLVPVSMHAVWNAFTLGVGAFACKQ
jgi:hypothetical protein